MTENTPEIRDDLRPEEMKRLHAALLTLSPLVPAPGFADRVMRRVHLPLPWRARVRAAVREHVAGTAAAFAGLVGLVALGAAWAARYPEVNPVAVAGFIVQRSTTVLWGAVMELGRLVYGSGILTVAQGAVEQLTLTTAFLAVATVTLVGLGALRIMLNLLNVAPAAQQVSRA